MTGVAEFVGGPRCGERRAIEELTAVIQFRVAKRGQTIRYRRRPKRRRFTKHEITYYDFVPAVRA